MFWTWQKFGCLRGIRKQGERKKKSRAITQWETNNWNTVMSKKICSWLMAKWSEVPVLCGGLRGYTLNIKDQILLYMVQSWM